jgi:hypothetical protein
MAITPEFLITLTAAITPDKNYSIKRRNPELRRADYLRAFHYWLSHPDPRFRKILFLENSGADLSEFNDVAHRSGKQVEIISTPVTQLPLGWHYGYSELQMLDHGLDRSLLRKETTHMVKVTGRLTMPALPKLLDRLPEGMLVAADGRGGIPFRKMEREHFLRLELFVARHDFYDSTLRKTYGLLTDVHRFPYLAESLFYEILAPMKDDKNVVLRFPINCEPVGYAAHTGKAWEGRSRLLVTTARAISRVVAPNVWV